MVDVLDILDEDEARLVLKLGESAAPRLAGAITAVSRRLDELCGPIVVRTFTAEEHDGCTDRIWLHHRPVSSITLVTEYDASGAATVLAAETPSVKPTNGYKADKRLQAVGLSGRLRRSGNGTAGTFASTVVVTYVAGRSATTAAVDPVFKEAGGVVLLNWWQQVLAQTPQPGNELDLPGYRFPRWAVPDAAKDLLAGEIQYDPGIA